MSESNAPQERPGGSVERPHETVLESVGRHTGKPPKVLLRDSDGEDSHGPYIDAKARGEQLFPKGRGNYQILGEIARGGMGVVLKGHDTDLGRDVAVKVLDEKLAGRPEVLHRFVEEAQIGGQLQHPGVVPVYEMGLMSDERPYFTMKLVKGRTLAALLAKRRSLEDDRRRFLSIFEAVCQTVAYAHSKGVIHRDLKPANVMVGAFGEVQVVDWGLAKVLQGGGVADELMARRSQFTVIETVRSGPGSAGSDSMVGSVMGTPAYMAPEQALGEIDKVDERSDVFALGAILCEVLTGQPPYVAAEKERTVALAAHAKLDPARGRVAAADVDAELKELCLECLSPAQAARPQNAEEVAERMHGYLSTLEERAHAAQLAAAEARAQRRRVRLVAALAVTVLASVVTIGLVLRGGELERREQRERQLAAAQRTLDDGQAQALALQEEGRLDEALEVARATLATLQLEPVLPDEARARGEHMVARLEQLVAERELRAERDARNAALLMRCEELRMRQIEEGYITAPANLGQVLEDGYAAAFRDYGIDLADPDLPSTLAVLRGSGIAEEAALALDDWASVRRQVYGWDAYETEAVTALAFDLDPDPLRTRMREALLAFDREALVELSRSEDLEALPASSLWVLGQGLSAVQEREATRAVLRLGTRAHRDDFLLNLKLGILNTDEEQYQAAARYLYAARALRPNNSVTLAILGDTYFALGAHPEALECYRAVCELRPDLQRMHRFVGMNALFSGRYELAVRELEVALQASSDELGARLRLDVARAMAGALSLPELLERYAGGAYEDMRPLIGWTATFLPFRAQRDPRAAIELIAPLLRRTDWGAHADAVVAAAHLELGEPEAALAVLDEVERKPPAKVDEARAVLEMHRARALGMLGREEEGRLRLEFAERLLRERLGLGWDAWRDSSLEESYRRAQEALGR